MRRIGEVVRLQVQERSLKVGRAPRERYDSSGLRMVPGLVLTEGGVRGIEPDGAAIADVHHRDHPASKYRGENAISVGFTANYAAMRRRFGAIVTDGIAGENILVACDELLSPEQIAPGLVIETASGRAALVDVIVATPCAPFTRFALRFPDDARPDASVTDALRFLDDGMRGYYAAYHGPDVRLAPGNAVYLLTR